MLDCTVRDGGFANGWDFPVDFVSALYRALDEAGLDSMEVGFANARERWDVPDPRPWQSVTEALLRKAVPTKARTKLAVMVDVWGVPDGPVARRRNGALDLVRVAGRLRNLDAALDLVARFHHAGYETSFNLLAVAEIPPAELDRALARIAGSPAGVVYVVDSYGHLDPRVVCGLVERFRQALPGKAIGFHGHNNRQLALANTLAALESGATFVDASLLGMGRGAGNCPLELLVGLLDPSHSSLVPLLRFVEDHRTAFARARWGYSVPLMLTGLLNRHPREATEDLVREFTARAVSPRSRSS